MSKLHLRIIVQPYYYRGIRKEGNVRYNARAYVNLPNEPSSFATAPQGSGKTGPEALGNMLLAMGSQGIIEITVLEDIA